MLQWSILNMQIWNTSKRHTYWESESVKKSVQRYSCMDQAWLMSRTLTQRCDSSLSFARMSHFAESGCYRWLRRHVCGIGASWPCRQTSGCIWEKKKTINCPAGYFYITKRTEWGDHWMTIMNKDSMNTPPHMVTKILNLLCMWKPVTELYGSNICWIVRYAVIIPTFTVQLSHTAVLTLLQLL